MTELNKPQVLVPIFKTEPSEQMTPLSKQDHNLDPGPELRRGILTEVVAPPKKETLACEVQHPLAAMASHLPLWPYTYSPK